MRATHPRQADPPPDLHQRTDWEPSPLPPSPPLTPSAGGGLSAGLRPAASCSERHSPRPALPVQPRAPGEAARRLAGSSTIVRMAAPCPSAAGISMAELASPRPPACSPPEDLPNNTVWGFYFFFFSFPLPSQIVSINRLFLVKTSQN